MGKIRGNRKTPSQDQWSRRILVILEGTLYMPCHTETSLQ